MSKAGDFIKRALPVVMTVVGSAATVAGIFFAAKEGPKYKEATEGKGMTVGQKVVAGAKIFAPAIGCAVLSVSCGVGAHMIDAKTQASLMGAYAVLEKGYKEYKKKNEELNGEEADMNVRVAMEEEKLPEKLIELDGDKPCMVHLKNLCEDIPEITFISTKYISLKAIARFNKMLEVVEVMSVNDLLELFERDPIEGGSDIGWSSETLFRNYRMSSLEFDMTDEEDGSFTVSPMIMADGAYLIDSGLFE